MLVLEEKSELKIRYDEDEVMEEDESRNITHRTNKSGMKKDNVVKKLDMNNINMTTSKKIPTKLNK